MRSNRGVLRLGVVVEVIGCLLFLVFCYSVGVVHKEYTELQESRFGDMRHLSWVYASNVVKLAKEGVTPDVSGNEFLNDLSTADMQCNEQWNEYRQRSEAVRLVLMLGCLGCIAFGAIVRAVWGLRLE